MKRYNLFADKIKKERKNDRVYIFGPVPSRRLGKSLGVNIIPPGYCTYSCVYCQLGRTAKMQLELMEIENKEEIKRELEEKLKSFEEKGEGVDYLTFVADGEPTLVTGMADFIHSLKDYQKKIAVITNSSLLWKKEVREGLLEADWVSLKCDSFVEATWKKVDRPHGRLELETIKRGMLEFASLFRGELVTESMLIKGLNDTDKEFKEIIKFIKLLSPDKSYLSILTRPPAEKDIYPARYESLTRAYHQFKEVGLETEYLMGYEGNEFASSGDIESDILSITAVHPLKEEAVQELIERDGASWSDIEKMLAEDKLVEVKFEDSCYYIRVGDNDFI